MPEKTLEQQLAESMKQSTPQGQEIPSPMKVVEEIKNRPNNPPPPNLVLEPLKIDWPAAEKKVATIDAQLEAAKGKKDNNPYMWAKKNKWTKIKDGIKARDVSAYQLLQALPTTIDTTVINIGPVVLEAAKFKPQVTNQ